ncbi:aminopeptidase P family protein [Sphingobium lignivorans]|uniref:Xaa-Pro aminopeptidase n=1 Tax=Sphingobium lignivorans TaxID=2735886 RepID=A0ABR6N9V0_9SPHN|nr:aminopeptidase P family protein [Sphingobium lignivorans]MBB5984045.1 Xaa-Pro aminopeptidase [Sphingobium lignivorans]
MSTHEDRLKALRDQLARQSLDGFVVPLTDEYLSEYVGAYAQRLAWLTGFLGSAGSAVVLPEDAAIFVDGRYTLQVRDQVDGRQWQYQSVPQTSIAAWLSEHAPAGARIGYDPWLHTRRWVQDAGKALAKRGATLVPVSANPVDAVWDDQPEPSKARLIAQADAYTGKSSAAKRAEMIDWMKDEDVDATVLTALDSIAWTFNIRGTDVARTPVALAYALVHADGRAELFVAPEKIDADVQAHLGNAVTLRDRSEFTQALMALGGRTVAVDPDRAVAAIFETLDKAGASVRAVRDPSILPKAIKNEVEIAGQKKAQALDGAAMAKFLHWLSIEGPTGRQTEISASDQLQRYREEMGAVDLSFDTISGSGPNGAIVHYKASEATNRPVEPGTLFLVDSGGQYREGTTDITRTMAIGTPTEEMRHNFTLVLKGHIALASVKFPAGTRGNQLDVLARQFLWAEGLDYAHGTGHGVGSFLSVHEGPQRIGTFGAGTDEPILPGMIFSNEPGYYVTGAYGIRIENLVLVVDADIPGAEKPFYGFETLSHTPIDRSLIVTEMLTPAERQWVDDYHARTLAIIGPQLEGEAKAWLERACAPL